MPIATSTVFLLFFCRSPLHAHPPGLKLQWFALLTRLQIAIGVLCPITLGFSPDSFIQPLTMEAAPEAISPFPAASPAERPGRAASVGG
jgi:hypothetical protein